jgi:predicted esterase
MKLVFLFFLSIFFSFGVFCQSKVEGVLNVQGTPRKLSILVPSRFKQGVTNAVIALHPLNTARWNGVSWRDTLAAFAEQNQCFLICPDGGTDGRIDDPVDALFISAIIETIPLLYGYNTNKVVLMGFSVGGLATYTYGLSHVDKFIGFIPIGAAINGTTEIENLAKNAKDKIIYLVHGSEDDLNNRFLPAKSLLIESKACVKDSVLNGVGHTIDFPNRNEILSHAYQYILTNSCSTTDIQTESEFEVLNIQNPASQQIFIPESLSHFSITILNSFGQNMCKLHTGENAISHLTSGVYFLRIENGSKVKTQKIVIEN